MRHAAPTLALCMFAVGCGDDGATSAADAGPLDVDASTAPASGSVLVLSYNVAGLPDQLSGSNPEVNTAMISPHLDEFDLALVQEDWLAPPDNPLAGLFTTYHDMLAADAHHPYQSVPATNPFGSDPAHPDAVLADGLNRFSRSPFGMLTRVAWEGCFGGIDTSDGGASDCLATKGFSVATHTFANGVVVDVYNLHGEAGATETDQQLSQADFEQLAAYVVDHSAGHAVLLAGDTNLHTDDDNPDGMNGADAEIWRTFREATGLTDVCDVVDPCERGIDKLAFRSDDGVVLEPRSFDRRRDEFTRGDGEPLSDHDPVVVEVAWSRAP